MAARVPIKLVSTNNDYNLQAMTSTNVNAIVAQAVYLYGTDPAVRLSVSASNSGSSFATLIDTRMAAGAYSTNPYGFVLEAQTAEPYVVPNIEWKRLLRANDSPSQENENASYTKFPVYLDGSNNVRAMTQSDFMDSFIKPAINQLVGAGDQPGIYRIHTGSSLSDHTLVSNNVVFTDTRANTSRYTYGGIPEVQDQPQAVTNYYLHIANAGLASNYTLPMYIDGSNNLRQYGRTAFNNLLINSIRYASINEAGYRIQYNINGSGTTKGSGMTDTRLNGSGDWTARFVNADDYRSQEFPNGTATSINTYFLKVQTS